MVTVHKAKGHESPFIWLTTLTEIILALSRHSYTICISGMVAVFRNSYQSKQACIQSNPGLYDEGMACWREAKTKTTSYCFWYLGCWSRGQIFSKKTDDPYIWTHYLTADTNRLLVFQFSISTLSHFLLFSASRTELFYEMAYPRVVFQLHTCTWLTAAAYSCGLQLRQQHLSCIQHSSQASLTTWA